MNSDDKRPIWSTLKEGDVLFKIEDGRISRMIVHRVNHNQPTGDVVAVSYKRSMGSQVYFMEVKMNRGPISEHKPLLTSKRLGYAPNLNSARKCALQMIAYLVESLNTTVWETRKDRLVKTIQDLSLDELDVIEVLEGFENES